MNATFVTKSSATKVCSTLTWLAIQVKDPMFVTSVEPVIRGNRASTVTLHQFMKKSRESRTSSAQCARKLSTPTPNWNCTWLTIPKSEIMYAMNVENHSRLNNIWCITWRLMATSTFVVNTVIGCSTRGYTIKSIWGENITCVQKKLDEPFVTTLNHDIVMWSFCLIILIIKMHS